MANIDLDTRAPVLTCSGEERKNIVWAFNVHFRSIHALNERTIFWPYKYNYQTLKKGVELAIGHEILDPQYAIPESYTGDGSFQTTFQTPFGDTVTQTEYLPWDVPCRPGCEYEYDRLMPHSRSFIATHNGLYYPDRERLEAYYEWIFLKNQPNSRPYYSPQNIYRSATDTLSVRREIILPIVG